MPFYLELVKGVLAATSQNLESLRISCPLSVTSPRLFIFSSSHSLSHQTTTNTHTRIYVAGLYLHFQPPRGKRRALPNARIMIHQPLGSAQGQAADIEIQAKEILYIRACLNTYIADYTDQPISKVVMEMSLRTEISLCPLPKLNNHTTST